MVVNVVKISQTHTTVGGAVREAFGVVIPSYLAGKYLVGMNIGYVTTASAVSFNDGQILMGTDNPYHFFPEDRVLVSSPTVIPSGNWGVNLWGNVNFPVGALIYFGIEIIYSNEAINVFDWSQLNSVNYPIKPVQNGIIQG